MNILLSLATWHPAHGGPFFSVGNLARQLAARGHEIDLAVADLPHRPVQEPPAGVRLHAVPGKLLPGLRQTWLPGVQARLADVIREASPVVVHDNGMWLSMNHAMAMAARRAGLPRIVSPRGTLDPWAFRYRNWKKRIALALFQRRDLLAAHAFHAASDLEARNIREFGLTQPIAVIPNGVGIPEHAASFDGPPVALFVGRLHPVKNLPNLVRAWARVRPSGWKLRIVGSDEVGHRAELTALAREAGVADSIEIRDPAYGDEKDRLFREAHLFFLVSKSENFGISAAEALAYGIPVVASRSTPWELIQKTDAGWWVPGEVENLATAIREATTLGTDALRERGQRGRRTVAGEFGWEAIADRFAATYSWLGDGGAPPEWVV